MELPREFRKDKYRHAEFLKMIPIKEEKLVKLFLKRNNYQIALEKENFQ
jgi:hypothetical protein